MVVPDTLLLEFKFPLTWPLPATTKSEFNVATPPTSNVVPITATPLVRNASVVVIPTAVMFLALFMS